MAFTKPHGLMELNMQHHNNYTPFTPDTYIMSILYTECEATTIGLCIELYIMNNALNRVA